MNDLPLWISVAAFIVSLIALLHSFSRANITDQIVLEQKRSALRLESHSFAIRIADLCKEVCSADPTNQLVTIAKNLAEIGQGIGDCRRTIERLTPPPFIGVFMITKKFESWCTDFKEMVNILDMAERYWINRQLDELQRAVEGLHSRIWAGTKIASKL